MDRLAKLVVKLVFIAVTLTSLVRGQQRNTVFQQMANGLIANSVNTTSGYAISNNIGQVFHTFAVIGNGSSCNTIAGFPFSFTGYIQASYDNLNWFNLTQTVTGYFGQSNKLYRATGAYPYVKLLVTGFPASLDGSNNCSISIGYSGTLNGTSVADASNPNFVYQASGLNTTQCLPIVTFSMPAQIQSVFKIVGYSSGTLTGTPTQIAIYTDSACATVRGVFPVNQTVLPDTYFDTVLGTTFSSYANTWTLYGKTNAGTANVLIYLNCMN